MQNLHAYIYIYIENIYIYSFGVSVGATAEARKSELHQLFSSKAQKTRETSSDHHVWMFQLSGFYYSSRGIQALRVQSIQIWSMYVSALGIAIMAWGIYFIFGYLDPGDGCSACGSRRITYQETHGSTS